MKVATPRASKLPSTKRRARDPLLSLKAMAPGEFERGGKGLTVRWGVHPTPAGEAHFAMTERGVCAIDLSGPSAITLHARWPGAELLRDQAGTAAVAREVSRRMRGQARERLAVVVQGTPFQMKVWEALLAIPAGAVTTYGDVAARIGKPRAHRAAARAIGANAIAYLVPCHRVVRASGAIGGYRWGGAKKRALLALEAVPRINGKL